MIRLATYNIRHASLKGLDAIEDLLRPVDADAIALQEVDRDVGRSACTDQARLLAEALDMHFVYAEAMPLDGGAYGVALLSKTPILSSRAHPLPSLFEPRVMLRGTVDGPDGRPLDLAVTHLGLHPTERQRQVHAILEALGRCKRTLLMGDLNEGHTEAAFSLFGDAWVDCLAEAGPVPLVTYPSHAPTIGIDHVLRTRDLPQARSAWTVENLASDHLPVVVELR